MADRYRWRPDRPRSPTENNPSRTSLAISLAKRPDPVHFEPTSHREIFTSTRRSSSSGPRGPAITTTYKILPDPLSRNRKTGENTTGSSTLDAADDVFTRTRHSTDPGSATAPLQVTPSSKSSQKNADETFTAGICELCGYNIAAAPIEGLSQVCRNCGFNGYPLRSSNLVGLDQLFHPPRHLTDIADIPDIPDVPDYPDFPDIADIADIPDVPDYPDFPDIADIPDVPDYPDFPDIPDIPDIPDVPDYPDIPDIPDIPHDPDFPDFPHFPHFYSAPNAQHVSPPEIEPRLKPVKLVFETQDLSSTDSFDPAEHAKNAVPGLMALEMTSGGSSPGVAQMENIRSSHGLKGVLNIDTPTKSVVNIPLAEDDELADIPAEMRETVAQEIAAFRDRSNRRDMERLKREEEMEAVEYRESHHGDFSDDLSEASSIASIANSLFSIMSGSSMSSLPGPPGASERLVSLLLVDDTIKILCIKALSSLSREEFEKKLRRSFKEFGVNLRKEADSLPQRRAAHFVRFRARNSAHIICNKLNQDSKSTQPIPQAKPVEEDLDESSDSDRSDDELDDLQQLEDFIKASRAITVLRETLRTFVCPIEAKITDYTQRDGPQQRDIKAIDSKESKKGDQNLKTPTRPRSSAQVPAHMLRVWFGENFNVIESIITSLRVTIGKQRPNVEAGKTRIEWRCKCGHAIFDDFIELKPGATERYRQIMIHSDNSSTSTRSSSFSSLTRTLSGGLQSLRSFLSGGSGKGTGPGLPLHERQSPDNQLENGDSEQKPPIPSEHEILYLLLCYSQGRYATRLLQLDLLTLQAKSDKALFKMLRDNYRSMRGAILCYISLRTLCSIKFVHFEVYRSELVDVRKPDDIPPPENKDYRYQPAPPELIPPVGERHMMHLFEHPDHAEDESLCLDRFPKKLKEKLKCNGGVNPGWGLQFVEGWDARKIWVIVFVFFGLGSLLVGVLWAVYGHSIQNAFSIASYMVGLATVTVGTTQAFLVM